ncbi:response regulator [Streptomyces morookaense]|uniref:Response regulator transcription factor n=1 Tax=Streptomyces morookaense TaxID=1970 RepID=A0A7Y7B513_STRMO|nr:response regulator transcription factor [Streptomyces morookaense]NVK79130.1 response regulator transcription factor [Streptomyces morookaense]GHF28322.1 DNA-binding response regulator [Streptomyces morookaense]
MAIRLLIADDHPVVRAGLVGLLAGEDGLEIVGEADSGTAAIRLADELRPDVVLMDLRMPGLDGVAATAQISVRCPDVRVLILTTYDTDSNIVRAVEAGAAGYLLKDATPDALTAAIRAAAEGDTVLPPLIAAKLVNHVRAPVQETLTARELDVLRLVARGLTNAAIGRQLNIGETTVKTHLVRIFAKLDVGDRTAAVTVALQRRLLTDVFEARG